MRTRSLLVWRLLLILFLSFSLTSSFSDLAYAQAQNEVTMTADVGFDGLCETGTWIPVRITLENNGPDIEGQVEAYLDSSSGGRLTYAYPLNLPSQSRKEIFLYVYPDGYLTELSLFLVSGNKTIVQDKPRVSCFAQPFFLIGVIASSPSTFNTMSGIGTSGASSNVAQLELANIPDKVQGLLALDVLVISNVDTGTLRPAQKQALSSWIASGGKLLVTGGLGWQKTAAGLIDLLPITPTGLQNLTDLNSLLIFSRSSIPLEHDSQNIPVTTSILNPRSQLLVEQDGVPLVTTQEYGFGQVYFLAADPALAPLKNWDGLPDFYRTLFSYQFSAPGWATGFQNWYMAADAAKNMPGLRLPSVFLICCFLGLYVVALGPANYLALRLLKRRELAWISIPALVIIFSALAFLVGGFSRGRSPIINQLAIVQVWPDTGLARVDGVAGIYSPRRATYQVEFSEPFQVHQITGDYGSSPRDITILQSPELVTIPNLRIEVGAIQSYAVEGTISAPAITNNLKLILNDKGTILRGSITNNSSLVLEDVTLLYPGGVLTIGKFEPGAVYQVDLPLQKAQLAGQSLPTNMYYPTPIIASPVYSSYYGYVDDTTISDILGTTSYYDNEESYLRYNLLAATLVDYSGQRGRGGGIYLSGWSSGTPFQVNLKDHTIRTANQTLYLVNLQPIIESQGTILKLTPGLFAWNLLSDSGSTRISPYNGSIYTGEVQGLQFTLSMPISYSSVDSLTLHLQGGSGISGSSGLTISLWNFSTSTWDKFSNLNWGDSQVPDPGQYVGPGGAIQMHIENNTSQWVEITTSDFTLVVER
jgi:hypothetical protein